MTSRSAATEAFLWVWLPDQTDPVVAGRIELRRDTYVFNYGRSYMERDDAIPIYLPELPLERGEIAPLPRLTMAGCLRDAAPDAWGRRVVLNKLLGVKGKQADVGTLDELTYLLESGSDRIGALDFQMSATDYVPRSSEGASLTELMEAADRVERGMPLTPELEQALLHGSSLGGARPKAMIVDADKKLIAKFSSSTDTYNVVKAEYVAMRLAAKVGLNVAPVRFIRTAGKDVLLVERFDRQRAEDGWSRRMMVSALTMFELDEMMARYASYADLTEIIRHRFTEPKATLHELFGRLVFNILCGNTDDHARNHAAFWDGRFLTLTPAYDICPQNRAGGESTQAMLINDEERLSRLDVCVQACGQFQLDRKYAEAIVRAQIDTIRSSWEEVCGEAELAPVERAILENRMFLNPYIFEGDMNWGTDAKGLGDS